jgi:hypothetical protein
MEDKPLFNNLPQVIEDYINEFFIDRKGHKQLMDSICLEILNVCWCHGCGKRKYLGTSYVGKFCSKICWRHTQLEDIDNTNAWCILGENCLECNGNIEYSLAESLHIQRYYNLDPMGAKDKKYTKNAKPMIDIYS